MFRVPSAGSVFRPVHLPILGGVPVNDRVPSARPRHMGKPTRVGCPGSPFVPDLPKAWVHTGATEERREASSLFLRFSVCQFFSRIRYQPAARPGSADGDLPHHPVRHVRLAVPGVRHEAEQRVLARLEVHRASGCSRPCSGTRCRPSAWPAAGRSGSASRPACPAPSCRAPGASARTRAAARRRSPPADDVAAGRELRRDVERVVATASAARPPRAPAPRWSRAPR